MKLKRLAALLLALVLLCAMTACSTVEPGTDDGASLTPAEIVASAMEKMSALKSMDAALEMVMEMKAGDEGFTMNTAMDMTTFTDPMKLRAEMRMDMGELGAMDMSFYAQSEGDAYTMYVYDGANWVAQSVSLADMEQYSAQGSIDIYLDGAVDFVAAGTEELASGTADKYTGVIRGEALEKLLEEGAALDALTSTLGDDAASIADLYQDLGDLPISVWIDQASGYIVRFSMDMSDLMDKIVEKVTSELEAGEDVGLSIEMTVTMTYANFDAATDFTIPEEALNVA